MEQNDNALKSDSEEKRSHASPNVNARSMLAWMISDDPESYDRLWKKNAAAMTDCVIQMLGRPGKFTVEEIAKHNGCTPSAVRFIRRYFPKDVAAVEQEYRECEVLFQSCLKNTVGTMTPMRDHALTETAIATLAKALSHKSLRGRYTNGD